MLNPQALEGKRILVTTNLVAQRKSLCYHAFCTIQLLPMALDRHDPGGSQEQEDVPATFEGVVHRIRERLKSGGPPVDFAAIHLYIAGDLGEADSRRVSERIVTWQTWYRAYWETMLLLDAKNPTDQEREDRSSTHL